VTVGRTADKLERVDTEKTVRFLLENQARFFAGLEELRGAVNELKQTVDELKRNQNDIETFGNGMLEMTTRMSRLTDQVSKLADMQTHTVGRVKFLVDTMDELVRGPLHGLIPAPKE